MLLRMSVLHHQEVICLFLALEASLLMPWHIHVIRQLAARTQKRQLGSGSRSLQNIAGFLGA